MYFLIEISTQMENVKLTNRRDLRVRLTRLYIVYIYMYACVGVCVQAHAHTINDKL